MENKRLRELAGVQQLNEADANVTVGKVIQEMQNAIVKLKKLKPNDIINFEYDEGGSSEGARPYSSFDLRAGYDDDDEVAILQLIATPE